jgi:hypothetical protein
VDAVARVLLTEVVLFNLFKLHWYRNTNLNITKIHFFHSEVAMSNNGDNSENEPKALKIFPH